MPDRYLAFLFFSASRKLAGAIVLAGIACWHGQAQQQPLPTRPPQPLRIFIIQGQVSLPDGRPAVHAMVTLTNSGTRRQTYSGDEGRFEFPGMEAGSYSLTATSLADIQLVSETVNTDTNRTATNRLNVNLILREAAKARSSKARVITATEAAQRVPKEARKAFQQGLKLKQEGKPDKALERFSKAIEVFPEYFQSFSERGDIYVGQRKLTEAAADFAGALKIHAHYGPALRGSGYCKLEKHEFAGAAKDLDLSLSADPDNASTYLLLGIANFELGKNDVSRQALQRALSLGAIRAHIYLGNLYAREHHYRQAADELRLYLETEPTAFDAAQLRAMEAKWRSRSAEP